MRKNLFLAISLLLAVACNTENGEVEVPKPEPDVVIDERMADPNDKRLNKMYELIEEANGDIDDELFVELITTKVMCFANDINGTESGCHYGDRGEYYSIDNIIYWAHDLVGGEPAYIYVFEEDGTGKSCFLWQGLAAPEHPLAGKKCYLACNWSYDAESNTLYTSSDCAAEVLYCDNDIAILRGFINYNYAKYFDYCLFYVEFNKLDRETVLEEYSTLFELDL